MNSSIAVSFINISALQTEILIAQLFSIGFEGFEETESGLQAFISSVAFDEEAIKEIAANQNCTYTLSVIEETNWNAVWESSFSPVAVDDFVAIRADFHEPADNVVYEIIITPKMSFGTGHHATTHMMVQRMRGLDFRHKSVFDFGTGTGVLSILAEKLGADTVLAIDNDEWSIDNAMENCQKNNCKKIKLLKADSPVQMGSFDIILANINKNVILDNLSTLHSCLQKDGTLVLSGLLSEDETDIITATAPLGLELRHKQEGNNWICLSFSS